MATYHSQAAFLKAQTDKFRKMPGTFADLVSKQADAGLQDVIELTGGTVTTETLRKLGHPFGRGVSYGAGNAPRGASKAKLAKFGFKKNIPALPINQQTGKLRRSFRKRKRGNAWEVVSGGVEYAKFILSHDGTAIMVTRGLRQEVAKRAKARMHGIRQNLKGRI
jgi:hypothetical protein